MKSIIKINNNIDNLNYTFIVYKQINSWREQDDKMVAFVQLAHQGLEEHQD